MKNKRDEAVVPTFELPFLRCAGECVQVRLVNNPYTGNFDDTAPGVVLHLCSSSFSLWMTKANIDNFDIVVEEYGLLAQFEFEGKKHRLVLIYDTGLKKERLEEQWTSAK